MVLRLFLRLLAPLSVAGWLSAQVPPPCNTPAPLVGPASCQTADYLVVYRDVVSSAEVRQVTEELERRHRFVANSIWEYALKGFYAGELSAVQVARLRCEPVVALVERNLPWCFPGLPCPPAFVHSGPCVAPATATNVPTITHWGSIALIAVLLVVGATTLRSIA